MGRSGPKPPSFRRLCKLVVEMDLTDETACWAALDVQRRPLATETAVGEQGSRGREDRDRDGSNLIRAEPLSNRVAGKVPARRSFEI